MSKQRDSTVTPPATPLERALNHNESIRDTVEGSAAELAVINAVLTKEIPEPVKSGDVAQALRKTGEMEGRIYDAAQELAQVNEALEAEIDERNDLQRELKATQVALADAKAKAG